MRGDTETDGKRSITKIVSAISLAVNRRQQLPRRVPTETMGQRYQPETRDYTVTATSFRPLAARYLLSSDDIRKKQLTISRDREGEHMTRCKPPASPLRRDGRGSRHLRRRTYSNADIERRDPDSDPTGVSITGEKRHLPATNTGEVEAR